MVGTENVDGWVGKIFKNELPRRKQRGIKSGVFFHAPQAAGN
jgi:hypothetical protein